MSAESQEPKRTDPHMDEGRRMSFWIAYTLEKERKAAGLDHYQMATALGVNWRTIRRWEVGDTFGRRDELDRVVAGYAYVIGLEDGRELWDRALKRWREHGAPPLFVPIEGPAAAFAEAIRLESLRKRPGSEVQSRKRRASR